MVVFRKWENRLIFTHFDMKNGGFMASTPFADPKMANFDPSKSTHFDTCAKRWFQR